MRHIWNRILDGSVVLAGALLLLMTVMVAATIFFRIGAISAPGWVVQFSEYGLLWIPVMGAAWLLRHDKHVAVDVLTSRLSGRWQSRASLFHGIVGSLVCVAVTWSGVVVVWDHYRQGVMDIQVIDTPKWLILSIIPLGFLLLSIQYILKTLDEVRRIRSGVITHDS